jgi:hypothetical protein
MFPRILLGSWRVRGAGMQIEYEIAEQDFIDAQRLAIKNSPARHTLVVPFIRFSHAGFSRECRHTAGRFMAFLARAALFFVFYLYSALEET